MKLYFIAIIPTDKVSLQIEGFKDEVSAKHLENRAKKSPPHITMRPPFHMERSKEPKLINVLDNFAGELKSEPIMLNGFGRFRSDVIFVKPNKSPFLEELHCTLGKALVDAEIAKPVTKFPQFTPHITIGYKNFKKEAFEALWKGFSDRLYIQEFIPSGLTILRFDSKQWTKVHTSGFNVESNL